MNSRDTFEEHYRSAEVLMRVYRLLESEEGPRTEHIWLPKMREMIASSRNEDLILLLNELFIGIVRDRADLKPSFFRRDTLDLLLRQAVVAACSALDVYMPHLLNAHLPDVILIRQRNFMPNTGEMRNFFVDFRLKLDDIWPFAEESSVEERWAMITQRVLKFCADKTLSNDAGISAVLTLLGIDDPWQRIAEKAGERKEPLSDKLRKVVSRRNDIVHRADRLKTNPDGPPQSIDFTWTQNHVGAIKTIALASYDLVTYRVRELKEAAHTI